MWGFALSFWKVLIHNFWMDGELVMIFASLSAYSVSGFEQRAKFCELGSGDGRIWPVDLHELCR